uniref:hypothetical protein n=1 Tax=Polynucleobacter sp. TaxID=2029855 RepID=UPI00404749F3
MSNPARNFCFTFQNPTSETYSNLNTFIETHCKYGIYQLEYAPTTGTPHLQGYFQLKEKKRTSWLQKNLQKATYLIARGSPEENKRYCSKEGGENRYEHGEFVTCGERTDLRVVADRVAEGIPMREIAAEYPDTYIRNYRGLQVFRELILPVVSRDTNPMVYWYYGSTGTGKSRRAHELSPKAYWKPPTTKWWDGYDGES